MGPINFPIPRSVYQQTPEARQTAAVNAGVVPVGQKSTIPNKLPQVAPTNALPSWASQSNLVNQLVGGAGGDLAANPTVGTQTTAPNVATPNDARKTQTPDFRTNQADAGSKLAGGGGAFRTARVSSAALANVAPALADSPDLNMDVAEGVNKQPVVTEQRYVHNASLAEDGQGNGQSGSTGRGLLAGTDKDGNKIDYGDNPPDDTKETPVESGLFGGVQVGSKVVTQDQIQSFADSYGLTGEEGAEIFKMIAASRPAGNTDTIYKIEANGDGSFTVKFANEGGHTYPEGDMEITPEMVAQARARAGRTAEANANSKADANRQLALDELRKLGETDAPGMDEQAVQDLLTASDARRSLEQSKAISLAMRLGQDPETMQAQSAGINQEFGVAGMEDASKIKMQAAIQNLQSAMREYDAKLSAINQSAALFAGSAQAQEMAQIQAALLAKRSAAEKEMMKYQMQLQQQQAPGFGEILGGIGLGILGGGLNALTGGIFGGLENSISTKLWG